MRGLPSFFCLTAALILSAPNVLAAILTVNSVEDNTTAGDGLVTLREAIIAANFDTTTDLGETGDGADEIVFDSGVFGTPQTIVLTQGAYSLQGDITITGPGRSLLIIDADGSSRHFVAPQSPTTIGLSGMTLENGFETGSGGDGGSISITNGDLTIEEMRFQNNRTSRIAGGAIFHNNGNSLVIRHSAFAGNEATASGGAIWAGSDVLEIRNSSFTGNRAADDFLTSQGGAIFVSWGTDATLIESTFDTNAADNGNGGAINMTDNAANPSSLTVIRSTFSGNTASGNGGAIQTILNGNVTIDSSTFSGNTAGAGGGPAGAGGALSLIEPGQRLIRNSTIYGNTAADFAGGIHFAGGTNDIQNSIVASNSAPSDPDIRLTSTSVTVQHSLVESIDFGATNLTGAPTGFDPNLVDNGGPTLTHALNAGSNLVDAGSNALASADRLMFDQRRFIPGDAGGTVDIGAFEAGAAASASLSITKADSVDPVVAGAGLSYTVTVTNAGPSHATDVVVTDTLPAGVNLTSTDGCAEDPNGVPACSLGTISADDSAMVTINVTVDADTDGTITNEATVVSAVDDPDPGDNSASEETTVIAEADLSVAKTGPVTAIPGEQVTYTVEVSNNGPSDAQDVSVDDTAPAAFTFASASAPCAGGFPCDIGMLASGATISFDVTFDIASDATGSVDNTATVDTATPDPEPGNNSNTVSTTLEPESDLSIAKGDSVDPVVAGTGLTYTVTVANAGPSDATDVVATDTLPTEVTLVSTSGCSNDPGGVPDCNLGTIPAGGSAVYTIEVTVDAGTTGTIANEVTVDSAVDDPDPGDNSASEETTVITEADLAIAKIGPATATPGGQATYTIEVINNGPSDAQDVSLDDTPPAEFTFVSATVPCAGGFPCDIGTLAAGVTASFDVTFDIAPEANGSVDNTATVDTTTPDPESGNNSDTVTTALDPEADLAVTQTGPATATPGEQATYTIEVINNGPSDAQDVSVDGTRPAEFIFVSATSPCAGGFPCDIGTLATDATVSFEATFDIDAGAIGDLDNTAVASATTPDPVGDNDSSSVTTGMSPEADLVLAKQVSADSISAGIPFDYTLEVINNGPSEAANTVLTDNLPAGVTLLSSRGCAEDPAGAPTCTLGTLAVGDAAMVIYEVVYNGDNGETVVNTASVVSDAADPTPIDNSSSVGVQPILTIPVPAMRPLGLLMLALLMLAIGGFTVVRCIV